MDLIRVKQLVDSKKLQTRLKGTTGEDGSNNFWSLLKSGFSKTQDHRCPSPLIEMASFIEPKNLDLTEYLIKPVDLNMGKKKSSDETLKTQATGMSGATRFME